MRTRCVVGVLVLVALGAACGKKGPPLPPLRAWPVAPTELTARRMDDRVHVQLRVPASSQDPDAPVSVARVDIYARTVAAGDAAPTAAQLLQREFLIGTVSEPRPVPGEVITWTEASPAAPVDPSVRYYTAVAVSERGRAGIPSAILPVRLEPLPEPLDAPTLTYDAETLTVTWSAPDKAMVMVYWATPEGREDGPVQPTPLSTGSWTTPVVFDETRCVIIRRVVVDGTVSSASAAAGPVCETPQDRFPPPAPASLIGAAEPGRVSLVWEPVTVGDLAGYHVLRGAGAGATLLPLTTAPVVGSNFADLTAEPGVEYVYTVVAIDRSGNQSPQATPIRVTGR